MRPIVVQGDLSCVCHRKLVTSTQNTKKGRMNGKMERTKWGKEREKCEEGTKGGEMKRSEKKGKHE
jgi:hypothetical protein